MSNKIPCSGCGKIYPLWIAADAKPAICSECGARVEQRQVQPVIHANPNPIPTATPESTKKSNFGLIFFNTAIIGVALLLIISVIGFGVIMAITSTDNEPPHSDKLYITDASDEKSVAKAVGLVQNAMVSIHEEQASYFPFNFVPYSQAEFDKLPQEKRKDILSEGYPVVRNKQLAPNGGMGSCFLITHNGYAITNLHVVEGYLKARDDRQTYKVLEDAFDDDLQIIPKLVVYLDGRDHLAEVVYDSPEYDFAILKIDTVSNSPYFRLSSTPDIPRLTKVTVLGFPASSILGLDRYEVLVEMAKNQESKDPRNWFTDTNLEYVATAGEVSKVSERGDNGLIVQHTAIIDGGNSGGPLVTNEGVVLGINTWQSSYFTGTRMEGVGNNFSLSIRTVLDEIVEHNSPINVLWAPPLPKPDN